MGCRLWLHGDRQPEQIEGLLLKRRGDGQAVEGRRSPVGWMVFLVSVAR
jgi:hypothetical protein